MSPASGVLVLLLGAGAGLSQDQESLLSHRSYVYTTASCLQESCCSLAARVDINTTLDSELRHKQYLFVMSDLTTDCVSHVAADQAGAVFLARVEDGGRVETSVPGARQQFLRGVKTGLLELFLLGVSIHEGSYEPGEGGCQVEHSTMEGGLQIIKKCKRSDEKTKFLKLDVSSSESIELKYSGSGRSISRAESRTHSSSFSPSVAVSVSTQSALAASDTLPAVPSLGRHGEDAVGEAEAAEKEVYKLLVAVQKSGATSVNGSIAFSKLCLALENTDRTSYEKMLAKYKTKKVLKYFVEASAATRSEHIFPAIVPFLSKLKNKSLLEKYFIHLSFSKSPSEIVRSLVQQMQSLDQPLKETVIYTACKLLSDQNEEDLKQDVFSLIKGTSDGCRSEHCQRLLANCEAALGVDPYLERLVLQTKPGVGASQQARETAIKVISKSHMKARKDIELLSIFHNKTLDVMERLTAIQELQIDRNIAESLLASGGQFDEEVGDFLRKKILTSSQIEELSDKAKMKIKNYNFQSLSMSDQSMVIEKTIARLEDQEAQIKFGVLMKGSAMKRSSLVLGLRGAADMEMFRMDSRVGGLSSWLGVEDPQDDKDANAELHISLFGLPLRPLVLFSSLNELMDLYWSGRAEKMTSYLAGTFALLNEEREEELGNGVRARVRVLGTLALDLAARADLSVWSQSGDITCDNKVVVTLLVRVSLGPEPHLLSTQKVFSAGGSLVSRTQVRMAGGAPRVCVVLDQQPATLRTQDTRSRGGELTEGGDTQLLPGLTWNLNTKNNLMCNKI